ncbi:RHS repeat protein [Cytobacillus depressus]|uniref:RHS repeat protein n=1 Tax=Cytobacillus depressus TaxID=1602942 RepID=A0A6L3V1E2_9BACI|nr:RHS repeat protein [Cytobacillus depressus]
MFHILVNRLTAEKLPDGTVLSYEYDEAEI